ncbi:protein of unknown function [Burkholderia multivorans]
MALDSIHAPAWGGMRAPCLVRRLSHERGLPRLTGLPPLPTRFPGRFPAWLAPLFRT